MTVQRKYVKRCRRFSSFTDSGFDQIFLHVFSLLVSFLTGPGNFSLAKKKKKRCKSFCKKQLRFKIIQLQRFYRPPKWQPIDGRPLTSVIPSLSLGNFPFNFSKYFPGFLPRGPTPSISLHVFLFFFFVGERR